MEDAGINGGCNQGGAMLPPSNPICDAYYTLPKRDGEQKCFLEARVRIKR
jgi:hypothetical protein